MSEEPVISETSSRERNSELPGEICVISGKEQFSRCISEIRELSSNKCFVNTTLPQHNEDNNDMSEEPVISETYSRERNIELTGEICVISGKEQFSCCISEIRELSSNKCFVNTTLLEHEDNKAKLGESTSFRRSSPKRKVKPITESPTNLIIQDKSKTRKKKKRNLRKRKVTPNVQFREKNKSNKRNKSKYVC